jgi:hypothetical protein
MSLQGGQTVRERAAAGWVRALWVAAAWLSAAWAAAAGVRAAWEAAARGKP